MDSTNCGDLRGEIDKMLDIIPNDEEYLIFFKKLLESYLKLKTQL